MDGEVTKRKREAMSDRKREVKNRKHNTESCRFEKRREKTRSRRRQR